MNVAVVFPELDPRSGGGYTFQRTLYDALRAMEGETSHRFVYYVGAGDGDDEVMLRLSGRDRAAARLLRLGRDAQDRVLGMRALDRRGAFDRSLERRGIDLVWFATPYAQDCDPPFIFTVWDLQYRDQPWFPEVGRGGEWEQRNRHYSRYLPRATRVIVPNDAGREEVMRGFGVGAERILTLPHPTPALARDAQGFSDAISRRGISSPYLFYPAQYWPHKNHYGLLRALQALEERSENTFELVCVGSDKGGRGYVERLVRELGLTDRVHLLGFVPAADLVALYQSAHALVYLSFFGPENLPPLEAFALGCPVVAADVAGAREQLGDAALLVPPTAPDRVADAILSIGEPELRARLVCAGRERAQEASGERYVAGVLSFLDDFEPVRRCWS